MTEGSIQEVTRPREEPGEPAGPSDSPGAVKGGGNYPQMKPTGEAGPGDVPGSRRGVRPGLGLRVLGQSSERGLRARRPPPGTGAGRLLQGEMRGWLQGQRPLQSRWRPSPGIRWNEAAGPVSLCPLISG